MKDLRKEEIEVLQRLLKIVVYNEGSGLRSQDLPPLEQLYESDLDYKYEIRVDDFNRSKYLEERNQEYLPYFETYNEYCEKYYFGKVHFGQNLKYDSLIKNIPPRTKRFFESGGFQKLFEEQEKEKELKTINENKLRNEKIISDWLKKDYKADKRRSIWALGISIVAGIVSIASAIIAIIFYFFE